MSEINLVTLTLAKELLGINEEDFRILIKKNFDDLQFITFMKMWDDATIPKPAYVFVPRKC